MTGAPELPAWAALLVSALVVAGAAVTLVGSLGLWRLKSFYARVHAPALGATLGTGAMVLASMVALSLVEGRPVLHDVLILIFLSLTTPVTYMLLTRAALHRDRAESNPDVPGPRTPWESRPPG